MKQSKLYKRILGLVGTGIISALILTGCSNAGEHPLVGSDRRGQENMCGLPGSEPEVDKIFEDVEWVGTDGDRPRAKSPSDGYCEDTGNLPVGYTNTKKGAVLAATNFTLISIVWQTRDVDKSKTYDILYYPANPSEVENFWSQEPLPAGLTVDGYRIKNYEENQAEIEILYNTPANYSYNYTRQSVDQAWTAPLIWVDNTWKIDVAALDTQGSSPSKKANSRDFTPIEVPEKSKGEQSA